MGWMIIGLLLALLGGLAVFTRSSRRPVTDETLTTELLGPPSERAVPAPPVRQAQPPAAPPVRQEAEPPPAPLVRQEAEPPVAQATGEGNWLEIQLAWVGAWSERMHEHISSMAADRELMAEGQPRTSAARGIPQAEREPRTAAFLADDSRLTDHGVCELPQSRPVARRCIATTVKGNQCKLPAEPGDTTCAIHAKRSHP